MYCVPSCNRCCPATSRARGAARCHYETTERRERRRRIDEDESRRRAEPLGGTGSGALSLGSNQGTCSGLEDGERDEANDACGGDEDGLRNLVTPQNSQTRGRHDDGRYIVDG